MDRNVRRVVAAAVVVAASCNVYDPSLLVGGGGSSSGATGGKGSGGSSGKGGTGGSTGGSAGVGGTEVAGTAGRGGSAGGNAAGSAGASSGRGGSAGSTGGNDTSGTGGTDPMAGGGGEGGEAGMGPAMGGTGGQGGSAGQAGSGGTSGTGGSGGAGAGGKAGSGGTGGAGSGGAGAGSGGAGGAMTATGCAKLTVPLNGSTDQARFAISLSGNQDLSVTNTTITMVLLVAAGNGGLVAPYVQDSGFHLLRSASTVALSGTGTWKTITWNVPAEPQGTSGIVLTTSIRIGIQIWANGATSGLVDPTVVYVDSISVNTPSLSYPLTTTSTVDPTPASSHENTPGIMWLNNYAEDTLPETLTGTALAWQATCP